MTAELYQVQGSYLSENKYTDKTEKGQSMKIPQMKNVRILAKHFTFDPGVAIHEIY
jgi:hypothetical protein